MPGGHLVGDQHHLLRRRHVQPEEQRADAHQEQFAGIGVGLDVVRPVRPVPAELAAAQQCADTRGHGLYRDLADDRSEEHTSELQSLMRSSYAVFCLKKKKTKYVSHYTKNRTT